MEEWEGEEEEEGGEGEEKGWAVEEVGWGEFGLVVEVVGFSSEGSIGLGGGVIGRCWTCRLSGETTAVPGVWGGKVGSGKRLRLGWGKGGGVFWLRLPGRPKERLRKRKKPMRKERQRNKRHIETESEMVKMWECCWLGLE